MAAILFPNDLYEYPIGQFSLQQMHDAAFDIAFKDLASRLGGCG